MLLQYEDGSIFASGATSYLYQPASSAESTPRIIITIRLGNSVSSIDNYLEIPAFIDTGGIYVICSPEIAQEIELHPGDGIDTAELRSARGLFSGELFRVPLTFLPDVGENLTINSTILVPWSGYPWPKGLPCILGMMGCLERLRFAIDPDSDTFYFGEI